ncbi:hypothetical protein [Rubripirellula reticaptiva]|uniref:hypothetical protein n=1 Tax=Rubripirellula reticaptiva TaxID=2528013 RepID=UPI0016496E34|nr:hypothetical protein [Rubripirellula reticaptiva]
MTIAVEREDAPLAIDCFDFHLDRAFGEIIRPSQNGIVVIELLEQLSVGHTTGFVIGKFPLAAGDLTNGMLGQREVIKKK